MKLIECKNNLFESIKHVDEEGQEFWYARELQKVLEYDKWENFSKVIKKAMQACTNSNKKVLYDFLEVRKIVRAGATTKKVLDYKLSRYACYLTAQNGDSRKEVIGQAQTYFAIQTRKQELSELEYNNLSEDEKRLYQRNLVKKGNHSLNQAAKNAGVKNFDNFHNAGYKGLYNGETADDIAKRKHLRYRQDILDNMGSVELAANLFRITQTEEKLINDDIKTEKESNNAHYTIGKNIRAVIKKNGGTMPEDMPTPKKSIKEIEKNNKKLKQ